MFSCKRCQNEARDGVTCSLCAGRFDFPCAGITETGWRKLGERKSTWKCSSCKATQSASPHSASLRASPIPTDLDAIMIELKRLSTQMEPLPALVKNIRVIQNELAELKSLRAEYSDIKSSLEFVSAKLDTLTNKISSVEKEMDTIKMAQAELPALQERINKLEVLQGEAEQRSRANNIEIKGVPTSTDENLFTIVHKIGDIIDCHIPKEQIDYIARVPTRNDSQNKNIICSLHNSYTKNNFVAAAKKHKTLNASDLGLRGANRIYINDHLTLENKKLLNATKTRAKDRGFEYVWVQGCKIYLRKNNTSPKHIIKTERDLKKFLC